MTKAKSMREAEGWVTVWDAALKFPLTTDGFVAPVARL